MLTGKGIENPTIANLSARAFFGLFSWRPRSFHKRIVRQFSQSNFQHAYAADGKLTEATAKAGTAAVVPIIASHSAENTGTTDGKQIFVEKK